MTGRAVLRYLLRVLLLGVLLGMVLYLGYLAAGMLP
jgi:hypothetical protein